MKKFLVLCLCAALLFTLASCRDVAEKPFGDVQFIPGAATVIEQSPGHIVMEIADVAFEDVIRFYELAILTAGAQEITRDSTDDGFWSYTGVYGENRVLQITMRDGAEKVQILIGFVDEMKQP